MMTPEHALQVRQSFEKVTLAGGLLADLFYYRLFSLDPALRSLFAQDMRRQKRALIGLLQAAVAGLDDPAEFAPLLSTLGQRHADYGVKADDYATVGQALLWALEQCLGDGFTPSTRAAWQALYQVVSDMMLAAARQHPMRVTS